VACDFACIDTVMLRRYYLLFYIDVTSREVFFAGITTNPTRPWITQAARNLFLRHADRLTGPKALVRDRGSHFIDPFDEIFRTEGLKVLKTPVPTPVANAFAERWIGSLRPELLDRTPLWDRRQLERLVVDYTDRYNNHRPHRSLHQTPPRTSPEKTMAAPPPSLQVIKQPAATASSTNTETQHDQPRRNNGLPHRPLRCNSPAAIRNAARHTHPLGLAPHRRASTTAPTPPLPRHQRSPGSPTNPTTAHHNRSPSAR
jgi:hypothetical protein